MKINTIFFKKRRKAKMELEKYQYVNSAAIISEIIHKAKQKHLIPLDLQLFAAKNTPPAEPPADPEPPKNEPPAEPPKKGDDTPAWAQKIINLLESKPQEPKAEPQQQIPVPQPPARKEEDHQEPKEKKKSFWDYLM
jgi:hypothetical protein